MRTRLRRSRLGPWSLAAAVAAGGCGSDATDVLTRPVLVAPVNGFAVPQNRADIGCPLRPDAGHGFQIVFEWQPAQATRGVMGYDVVVKNLTAVNPMIDTFHSGSTRMVFTSCGSYVTDTNSEGWEWRVRARDMAESVGEWSDVGTFRFEPCRVDGRHCVALP